MKDSQTLHLIQNQKDYLLQIDVHPIQKKVQDVKEKLIVQITNVLLMEVIVIKKNKKPYTPKSIGHRRVIFCNYIYR